MMENKKENSLRVGLLDWLRVFFLVIEIPFLLVLLPVSFLLSRRLYVRIKDVLRADVSEVVVTPLKWFFQYKATIFLCLVLVVVFLFQVFYFDDFGIKYACYPKDVLSGTFYRLFTSIFLHGSLGHLGGNLVALFVFGRKVEKYMGWKVVPVFLASGIVANFVSGIIYYYLLGVNVPGWGASGAIAGLIMLSILMDPFSLIFFFSVPLPTFIVGWLFIYYDFLSRNVNDGIGHYVHLGGYFGVLLLTIFFERDKKRKLLKGVIVNVVMLGILFALGVLLKVVRLS